MDDIRYWLALLRVPGIGPVHYHALLKRYGTPRRIFDRAPRDGKVGGYLSSTSLHGLANPDWRTVDQDLKWISQSGRHALTLHDTRYPPLLKQIHDAPPVLYVLGDTAVLAARQLAIVGSRNPTPGGGETARDFAAELTRSGLTITSGLATGIDAAAHRGALAAGGLTVAVAATGLDRVYPARHQALAGDISKQGAIVSEFPPGSPPLPENFPRRNRIISGLSLGTLVVEATPRSGSLITARAALEQGREVFAIPGSIHNPCARGCHVLIREGAKLVEHIHDILEELEPLAHAMLIRPGHRPDSFLHTTLEETAARILGQIDFAPTTIDMLVERTGYPAERLYPVLLDLEMANHITPAPGGAYMRRPART